MKVSTHTASHMDTWLAVYLGLVELRLGLGLGLGLASQASCVYLPRMAIHTATAEASRVYRHFHKLLVSGIYTPSIDTIRINISFRCVFTHRLF